MSPCYMLLLLLSSRIATTDSTNLFPLTAAYGDEDEDEDEDDEDFEEQNSIQICCAWGNDLSDGILTYHIDDGDDSSENQQQAVRNAIEEWDAKIEPLDFDEASSKKKSDI